MPNPQETQELNEKLEKSKASVQALKKQLNLQKRQIDENNAVIKSKLADEALRASAPTTVDKRGSKCTYWEKVAQQAEEFTQPSGQQSYIEWSTGIMEIFAASCDLSIALAHTPIRDFLPDTILKDSISSLSENNPIRQLFPEGIPINDLGTKIEHNLLRPAAKTIAHKFKDAVGLQYADQGHLITYAMNVDKNGDFNTKAYKDTESFADNEQEAFDIGTAAWLGQHGYKYKKNDDNKAGKFIHLDTGEALTQATLKGINQRDPLSGFFSGNYKLNINELPERDPSSSPRM